VKDDVAIPPAKRLLSPEARLRKLLMQRLLPPVGRRKTLKEEFDDFAAGRPSARLERERKRRELEINLEIDECFLPFPADPAENDDEPEVPDQVLVFREGHNEDLRNRRGSYDDDDWDDDYPRTIDDDEALILLLASDLELEPETRAYIIHELQRPRYQVPPKVDANHEHREFAMCIAKCKQLLREAGLKALQAEADIAQALGISVEALRKRCQRGRRPA
jgi:hypothetical protein